jgi:hypothetical protein
MTEVPGTDRRQAGEEVLAETPLVPEPVEDAEDDPRTTAPKRERDREQEFG